MPPKRQRLRLRQIAWVYAPVTLFLTGLVMMLPGILLGGTLLVSLTLLGFCVSMWGSIYGFFLIVDGESFPARKQAAHKDRPRLYKPRSLRRKHPQQGIQVNFTEQGITFSLIRYQPPDKDWLDFLTLDFLRPWSRVRETPLKEVAVTGDQAVRLWAQVKQQAAVR